MTKPTKHDSPRELSQGPAPAFNEAGQTEAPHSAAAYADLNKKYTAALLASSSTQAELYRAHSRIRELEASLSEARNTTQIAPSPVDNSAEVERLEAEVEFLKAEVDALHQSQQQAHTQQQNVDQTQQHLLEELEAQKRNAAELQHLLQLKEAQLQELQSCFAQRVQRRLLAELHARPKVLKVAKKAKALLKKFR